MKSLKLYLLLGFSVIMFASCATYGWKPMQKGKTFSNSSLGYTFEIPEGWMKEMPSENPFTMSYEGPFLQKLEISVFKPKEKLKLEFTKRQISENMIPEELAELIEELVGIGRQRQ